MGHSKDLKLKAEMERQRLGLAEAVTDEQDTASGRAREPWESAEAVRKSYE